MQDLNERQQAFIRKITHEMKPKNHAYAEVYGGDPSDINTQSKASRLASNAKVKRSLEDIKNNMDDYAMSAFHRQIAMAQDPKTPANVKNDINKHILGLAGLSPTQKTENTNKKEFKGLTDKKSKQELAKILLEQ